MLRLLVVVLYVLAALPSACVGYPTNFSIPFVTWGPQPVNPTLVHQVNQSVYAGSLPPTNYSLPTLRMAGVITLTGADGGDGASIYAGLRFTVDMINAHGGLLVGGLPHLLSFTWADDGSSAEYLQLLYSGWLNDETIAVFLTPLVNDQLHTLLPLMSGTNRTFINLWDATPDLFQTPYPYMWTVIPAQTTVLLPAVTAINQRAQLYAQQLETEQTLPAVVDEAYVSPYGVVTVCMFTQMDPQQQAECDGIRSWIDATNAERRAAGALSADLIRIEVDALWNVSTASAEEAQYAESLLMCPDGVDLVVVCVDTSLTDIVTALDAMRDIQLRPRAALISSGVPTSPLSADIGWTTIAPTVPQLATLPHPTYTTATELFEAILVYYSYQAPSSVLELVIVAAFESLKAALASTASLGSIDLRQAFLSLNGTCFLTGILFDPATGTNQGFSSSPQQATAAGLVAVNSTSLVYPFDWPWTRIRVGDGLLQSQSSSTVVISAVMAVLGCWVGQIVLEQAVFVRRRGGWYQLWLFVVAVAMGLAGMWCSQFNQTIAVTVTVPTTGLSLPLSTSLWVALCASLSAVLLTWVGLLVLMGDVAAEITDSQVAGPLEFKLSSAANVARRERREALMEKRRKATLSFRGHLIHLKDSMSWRVLLGSAFISLALWLSRVALWYSWSLQARWAGSVSAWVVSGALSLVLITPATLCYYHAVRYRVLAVFVMGVAVVTDWQVHMALGEFEYAATVLLTPSALYTVLLSSTAVTLIAAVLCAIACFVFVGLQFSRMQLSRNGLSVLAASLESVIRELKHRLALAQAESARWRLQADNLTRVVECINIVRPIAKEYALAMASQANTSTWAELFRSGVASEGKTSATDFTVSTVPDPSAEGGRTLVRASGVAFLSSEQRHLSLQSSNGPSDVPGAVCSVDEPSESHSVTATAETLNEREKLSKHSLVQLDSSGAVPCLPSISARVCDDAEASLRSAPVDPKQELDQVISGVKAGDHHSRLKHYELDVLALLHEQAASAANRSFKVVSCHDEPPGAEFSLLHMPSVAVMMRKNGSGSGGAASAHSLVISSPSPSLTQLLQHPACVELLKDELESIHSVENCMFYLHAVRYRKLLHTAKARRLVAVHLYDTFIAEGSEQQINLGTTDRDAITAAIKRGRDDACTPTLFQRAEVEVCRLMETNVMKRFTGTIRHRLCIWLYHVLDVGLTNRGDGITDGNADGHEGVGFLASTSRVSVLPSTKKFEPSGVSRPSVSGLGVKE